MEIKLLLLLGTLHMVHCQTWTNARALRKHIFETSGYDKKIRPASNQTSPTANEVEPTGRCGIYYRAPDVRIDFYLLSINELDEVAETLSTTGYLELTWQDELLMWNAADFDGLESYLFPQDDVWKPDIALQNSVEKYKPLGVSTLNVVVHSAGLVFWDPFEVFKTTCPIDMAYFPFDEQTCSLSLVAWSYKNKKTEVGMRAGQKGINLDQYETNSEWDMIDSTVMEEENAIIFTLKIKRKPRYMVLTIILPVIMLSVLNLFVFWLPCDSGEKVSYAVTVFLAFTVFLTVTSAVLPTNSESLSIFSVYIIILTVQSTFITVITVIQIRIRQLESPVPKIIVRFVGVLYCQYCNKERAKVNPRKDNGKTENRGVPSKHIASDKTKNEDLQYKNEMDTTMIKEAIDDTTKMKDEKVAMKGAKNGNSEDENEVYIMTMKEALDDTTKIKDEEKCDWKEVANALDLLFFFLFTFLTIISSLVCLLH